MDGGKLEDIGMCLETSYREIFFDAMANPTRAMSGRPSIALQPLARKTRWGGFEAAICHSGGVVDSRSIYNFSCQTHLVHGLAVETCIFVDVLAKSAETALLPRGKHP